MLGNILEESVLNRLFRGLCVRGLLFAAACALPASAQDLTSQQNPKAGERMTLLLKDYDPKSMLHTSVHEAPRAKFPVIDVHNHVDDPWGDHAKNIPPAEVVRRMDSTNIQKIVILTGMWGNKLQGLIDKMVKPYPDRFIVFTQIDWSKIDDPNFSSEMVAQLDDAVRRGARGLKVLKDLGLGIKDKTGQFIPVDDPRLDPIWEECGRLGIPVAIHTSDPEAFFTPLDRRNERYEELNENPTWNFSGPNLQANISCCLREITSSRGIRTQSSLPCTWQIGPKIWTPFPIGSTNIPIWWWNSGRERPNSAGNHAAPGNSSSTIRTAYYSAQTASPRKRCTPITSAGWKPVMNTSPTQAIRDRDAG
jgi:amidohydrolase family protein